MTVSRQRAVETLVQRETRLEAERSTCTSRREVRIPTQAEDAKTNYVISLCSPFNALSYLHLTYRRKQI